MAYNWIILAVIIALYITQLEKIDYIYYHLDCNDSLGPLVINKQNTRKTYPSNTIYLFISGGYDSIFRLFQIVLSGLPVQPIYINVPYTDGYNIRRKNVKHELSSICKAISKLKMMGYSELIYPTKVITSCILTKHVLDAGKKFYQEYKFNRPITQYIYMAQISLYMNKIIETGVLCADEGAIWKTIGKIIDPYTKMMDINKINSRYELIFRNLRFPLCGVSKKQMLQESIKKGFSDALYNTISCWYPDKNGKPCKKCIMCIERII
jgi:hypothetical protein